MVGSILEQLVASIVERVIQDAPHQVGVVYGDIVPDKIRRVVVPVTKGSNCKLAAELAPGFAVQFDARVRALTVIPNDASGSEAQSMEASARKTLEDAQSDAELEVLRRRDVKPGLVGALGRTDLVLIGAASTDPMAALLAETLPAVIAKMSRGPMIVVRDVEAHRTGRFEGFFSRGR
jgi:nucleotide-binding universal stress UspA family protein